MTDKNLRGVTLQMKTQGGPEDFPACFAGVACLPMFLREAHFSLE